MAPVSSDARLASKFLFDVCAYGLCHARWVGTVRERAEKLSIATHKVDERRVVHQVLGGMRIADLGIKYPVELRRLLDLLLCARESNESWVKVCDILREIVDGVPFQVDGDEERPH
jgi:hypothetical protein